MSADADSILALPLSRAFTAEMRSAPTVTDGDGASGITAAVTVMVISSDSSPASALMTAEPALMAFALQSLEIITTPSSEESHVTVLSSAFSGSTVALSWSSSPTVRVAPFWSMATLLTFTITFTVVQDAAAAMRKATVSFLKELIAFI